MRRATFDLPPSERRWTRLPRETADLNPLLRQMEQRGEIKPIKDLHRVFEVTVPYARIGPVDDLELLLEVHPYVALSHLSALAFHGLTDELPKTIYALIPSTVGPDLLPLGTEPRDWEGLSFVRGDKPPRVLGRPVHWVQTKPERFFGFGIYQPRGVPVRVTTPERTLLDGLQAPKLSGGIANVLRAWTLARDTLQLDVLVDYAERYGVGVLRQRVGFVLDELGLAHPALDRWRRQSQRGGSSRLVGSAPYAPQFSEPWNLSLNAPVAILHGSDG